MSYPHGRDMISIMPGQDDDRPIDESRRRFLVQSAAVTTTLFVPPIGGATPPEKQQTSGAPVVLTVNGARHELQLDPRTTLLDALRDHLDLTGTKKGCDQGACGACTVLVDGRRI